MAKNKKTYTLEELVDLNIDSWVEAMGHLDDLPDFKKEVMAEADEEAIAQWKEMDECPAELESEFTEVANRHNYRFDKDGNIVSFDK